MRPPPLAPPAYLSAFLVMGRLFQLGITRLRTHLQPIDVAADALEVQPQTIHIPLLSEQSDVHLLQLVLHVHEQRFDGGQPFGGRRIVEHR